jgi:iron complex transport system permease protein
VGATLLVLADTAARTAFAPREVPVGLLTAALGAPVFLWLLGRREVLA